MGHKGFRARLSPRSISRGCWHSQGPGRASSPSMNLHKATLQDSKLLSEPLSTSRGGRVATGGGELPFEAGQLTKEQGPKGLEGGKGTARGCREPALGGGRRLGHGVRGGRSGYSVPGGQVSLGLPAEGSLLPHELLFPFLRAKIAPLVEGADLVFDPEGNPS